jgi:esterase/lipase superfamily enzyme
MKTNSLVWCLVLAGMLGGCAGSSRPLMPTPNLYSGENPAAVFDASFAEPANTDANILYVTDREPDNEQGEPLNYGYGRSPSIAFGSAIVRMGDNLSWDQLASSSLEVDRKPKVEMTMGPITELGRTPAIPYPMIVQDGVLKPDPKAITEARKDTALFQQELTHRLNVSPKKEVVLFIHGYNNKFRDTAFTMAETWHFLGRVHVPVIYTWPAGRGGAKGYLYDRESGEFTVHHLKVVLKHLAANESLEKIHIIAHSRGTDVTTSALRELFIEARAAGEDPREVYRIENLVLAAPDLDFDVFMQRMMAERVGQGVNHLTIYSSQGDKAIRFAERFLGSSARMGRVQVKNFSAEQIKSMKEYTDVAFVELTSDTDTLGHGYFYSSPEASSDLILLIRYGKLPGSENGRPLVSKGANFWVIEDGYPN